MMQMNVRKDQQQFSSSDDSPDLASVADLWYARHQPDLQAEHRIQQQDTAYGSCMETLQIEVSKQPPDSWQKPQSRKSPDPAVRPGGHKPVHFSHESNWQQDWRDCLHNAFLSDE